MADVTAQIPASRVPLLDVATGLMSREWYRFFYGLLVETDAIGGEVNFDNVRRISFNTNPSPPVSFGTGTLAWDTSDDTLSLGMDYGVVQQMGYVK